MRILPSLARVASLIIDGALTFTTASAKIIPGATSLVFRNTADSADNLVITDAGVVTARAGLVATTGGVTATAGGVTATAGNVAITAGNLTFAAASPVIVSGSTDLTVRNNANSSSFIQIVNATGIVNLGFVLAAGSQASATGDIASSATIPVNPGLARYTPAASRTGLVLAAGTVTGQKMTVINNSASNTLTFAASGTSRVADGVSAVIAVLRSMEFTWDNTAALWYRS